MHDDFESELRFLFDACALAFGPPDTAADRDAALDDVAARAKSFLDRHQDGLLERLQRLRPDLLMAMQRVGREAIRALLARLIRDPSVLERLRRSSQWLLHRHPAQGSADRSALYMTGITWMLRRLDTSWPDFRDSESLVAYLNRVLERSAQNGKRKRGELLPGSEAVDAMLDAAVEGMPNPPSAIDRLESLDHERRDAAIDADLDRLEPMEHRVLFRLHHTYGMTFAALARLWPDPVLTEQQRADRIKRGYHRFIERQRPLEGEA